MKNLLKKLEGGDRRSIGKVEEVIHDKSNIVITFSLQALAEFALEDKSLRPRVIKVLEKLTQTGSPAVKNRAEKLLAQLNEIEKNQPG